MCRKAHINLKPVMLCAVQMAALWIVCQVTQFYNVLNCKTSVLCFTFSLSIFIEDFNFEVVPVPPTL